MKRGQFFIVIALVILPNLALLLSNLLQERHLRIQYSDEFSIRARSNGLLPGFTEQRKRWCIEAAEANQIPVEILAAVITHENGRTGGDAGLWRIAPAIKQGIFDPRKWQYYGLAWFVRDKMNGFVFDSPTRRQEFISALASAYKSADPKEWDKTVGFLVEYYRNGFEPAKVKPKGAKPKGKGVAHKTPKKRRAR